MTPLSPREEEILRLRIAHVDMDAFFASVEEKMRPPLSKVPLAVGGEPGSRGVVSTANYRARGFGVGSGMPLGRAMGLCPGLVRVPTDGAKYRHFSLAVLKILDRFTPWVEPASVDEAFLDFNGLERRWPDLREAARKIQECIATEVGVTASVGVGPGKMIAKIASGLNKPAGVTVLTRSGFRSLVGEMPVGKLWGVGEKTEAALHRMGIVRVKDLAAADPSLLADRLGEAGLWLGRSARGELEAEVVPYFEQVPEKSMGHEVTPAEDMADPAEVRGVLRSLSEKVSRRLRKKGRSGRTITLKIRFPDFKTITRNRTLDFPTDDGRKISGIAHNLWDSAGSLPVRLLGVSVSGLEEGSSGRQEELFENAQERESLLQAVDGIRDRWGERVIGFGGRR
ncbi:MAG: DNA polymerase IV [Gemmatimonadota bacterium]|jgi:DNA polymerase-4|nr:DNA polymerase IV [Gemmatimonadota bacterium]MDP6803050.1 DNA polymerase IV [Gemmatimonadota bacterium]MDP7032009.1 DNA polymerase IV [Gemmatimonadota bacterium]